MPPILLTIPAQLIRYYISVARGIDPDFPRNLSETLTVDRGELEQISST